MKRKIICALLSMFMLNGLVTPIYASEINNANNSNVIERAVTESHNVIGYNTFLVYFTDDFGSGYSQNCGPTLAANALSYYKSRGCSNLFSENMMSASTYSQICRDVNFRNGDGTRFHDVANGIKKYANRAGYNCTVDIYMLNLWSDVTRDINANKVVLLNYYGNEEATTRHGYLVTGYRINNGVKQLRVETGLSDNPGGYIDFNSNMKMICVNIY